MRLIAFIAPHEKDMIRWLESEHNAKYRDDTVLVNSMEDVTGVQFTKVVFGYRAEEVDIRVCEAALNSVEKSEREGLTFKEEL